MAKKKLVQRAVRLDQKTFDEYNRACANKNLSMHGTTVELAKEFIENKELQTTIKKRKENKKC